MRYSVEVIESVLRVHFFRETMYWRNSIMLDVFCGMWSSCRVVMCSEHSGLVLAALLVLLSSCCTATVGTNFSLPILNIRIHLKLEIKSIAVKAMQYQQKKVRMLDNG